MGHDHRARTRVSAPAGVALTAFAVWSAACVDTGPRMRPGGVITGTLVCDAPPPVPYAGSAAIPTNDPTATGPYQWQNAVIKGGGFVSGIVTSPIMPGLTFSRTDVGGAYRYDPANRRWRAITDGFGRNDSNLTGIESIAPDPVDPNRVYVAAGQYLTAGNGVILSSTDMGETWTRHNISAPMGGNADGRSMGERLAVDPNLPSTLYFGSRNAGLFRSTDSAQTWTLVDSFRDNGTPPALITGATGGDGSLGYGLTFVAFDTHSGVPGSATPTIYVGVGITNGTALLRSTDAGASWSAVAGQPVAGMPHHGVVDGCGNLYLPYNNGAGPNGVTLGAVWRYDGTSGKWSDVSPPRSSGGFGGLSIDAAHPQTLLASTIDNWGSQAEVYRTTDSGASWTPLLEPGQKSVAGADWLYWHSSNLPALGWMGDVEIDPFNPDRALYITGQGIWSSDDITAADAKMPTHWSFDDDGLEETVALDVASPPTGAPLFSGVGDIAGFRHDDLSVSPVGGMYSAPIFGNTTGLDFAENNPTYVARVGTFNSTNGRGAYSTEGGMTWHQFAGAPAGSNGSGLIAVSAEVVSADTAWLVWAPARVAPFYSHNGGATWTAAMFPANAGTLTGARVASDRVNPSTFYASVRNTMYVSHDGGATFTAGGAVPAGRPRPVFGIEGDLWVPTGPALFHSQDSGASFTQVLQVGAANAVGFGMPAPGQTYPAVYLAGTVGGTPGIYRSDDAGTNWTRIDDPQHQFGVVNVLTGDQRTFGRVYLGTGGRGIVYGDPQPQQ